MTAGTDAHASSVPDVTFTAQAADEAPQVEARIDEVTVFSDRARVRKRGQVTLKAGISLVRLPELPGAVMLDTIRLAAQGAKVLRVEALPKTRQRQGIDQAINLIEELEKVDEETPSRSPCPTS